MSWSEFSSLLTGIMAETPLGQIVSIRAEKDPNNLKNFTKEQRKIRNDWILKKNKKLKENPEAYKNHIDGFQAWAKAIFGNSGKEGDSK